VKALAHFDEVWSRCARLSTLHAYLAKNVSGVLQPDELLRAEWVARVSALDLYIHELVAQSMLAIFEGQRPASPAYLRFQISNDTLSRIRAAASTSEASAAFDLYVRDRLSRLTYQDPDDIADGVRLCSTIELWHEVAIHFGATPSTKADQAKSLKTQLSLIVRRRNIIAHEGDLQQSPLREPWPISQADLAFVGNQIEGLVRAIDAVVV
jgi:hypothetical protein